MKQVLVVSPSFPPASTADLHRVRTSLSHYREFGWTPEVLALDPKAHGGLIEPELMVTVPADVPVTRTGALEARLMRYIGIGDGGLRAIGHLHAAGSRIIKRKRIDLVFFSTTMFPLTVLGRLWKARFGTPYVVDFQDAWKTDYHGAGRHTGTRARLANAMHAVLEPLTMRKADGVVAVSESYIALLRQRYPELADVPCETVPFGASRDDMEAARALDWRNTFFDRDDGHFHGVAVGRGGRDLGMAAEILFRAVRLIADRERPSRAVKLSFIGTDYAPAGRGQETLTPIAAAFGVGTSVVEHPARVPYLQALRLLDDSHFTIMLGSDDAAYSPSKVYPYLLTPRPFVAIVHRASPVVPLLKEAGTGVVARFEPGEDLAPIVASVAERLERVLARLPERVEPPAALLESVSAREFTRRQCLVFDQAARRHAVVGVPCTE